MTFQKTRHTQDTEKPNSPDLDDSHLTPKEPNSNDLELVNAEKKQSEENVKKSSNADESENAHVLEVEVCCKQILSIFISII